MYRYSPENIVKFVANWTRDIIASKEKAHSYIKVYTDVLVMWIYLFSFQIMTSS